MTFSLFSFFAMTTQVTFASAVTNSSSFAFKHHLVHEQYLDPKTKTIVQQ